MPFEYMPMTLERVTKLAVIVDLAIKDNPDGSVFVRHGLCPS